MADILSFDKNCHHVSDDDLVWTLTLTTSDQKLAEQVNNYVERLIAQKKSEVAYARLRQLQICIPGDNTAAV